MLSYMCVMSLGDAISEEMSPVEESVDPAKVSEPGSLDKAVDEGSRV